MATEEKAKLTPKQELFCQYYTKNEALFGNATLAYAEAYGYDLDSLDRTPVYAEDKKTIIEDSEYTKAYNVCSVQGSKHLRNPKIQARITELLNELMRDDVVDAQLAKLIMQDHKPEAKIAAIREYNKLKQRIIEKIDHTTQGEKIEGINYIVPNAPNPHSDVEAASSVSSIVQPGS